MARFKIENAMDTDFEVILNTEQEVAEWVEENISEDGYDDWLDELDEVRIGSLTYRASEVLKRVDPIAYRCGYSDWLDEITSGIVYELERMDVGDWSTLYEVDTHLYVTWIEDEEE